MNQYELAVIEGQKKFSEHSKKTLKEMGKKGIKIPLVTISPEFEAELERMKNVKIKVCICKG